jgi:hypothetical protein
MSAHSRRATNDTCGLAAISLAAEKDIRSCPDCGAQLLRISPETLAVTMNILMRNTVVLDQNQLVSALVRARTLRFRFVHGVRLSVVVDFARTRRAKSRRFAFEDGWIPHSSGSERLIVNATVAQEVK